VTYWPEIGATMRAPRLRFDPAVPSRAHTHPFIGLRQHGAYSLGALEGESPRLLLVYPTALAAQAQALSQKLLGGAGTYPGFARLFGLPDQFAANLAEHELQIGAMSIPEMREAYERELREWAQAPGREDPDLAIVVVPGSDPWELETPYYAAKSFFASRAIPSQMVTSELLNDQRQLGWSLANIALASFAKLGGIPWVVDAREDEGDLVIGIGRAEVAHGSERRRIFGYAVAFIHNGANLDTASFTPAADESSYRERLTEAITHALEAERSVDEEPRRIIIHLAKRTGGTEVEAARAALERSAHASLPVAFLRIDDTSLFEFINTSVDTYAPPKGLCVRLGERRALLQSEGETKYGPSRRPLLLELDRRSTVGPEELGRLTLQAFRLAHANWRGFNSRSKPVTLLYGEQLAELVGYMEQARWGPSTLSDKLQRRPWFL